jgi:hypothetical protein
MSRNEETFDFVSAFHILNFQIVLLNNSIQFENDTKLCLMWNILTNEYNISHKINTKLN